MITSKALMLVQDPFGNYVVQHIMEQFPQEEQTQRLIANLIGSINELCVQKFSSNVIEKVLVRTLFMNDSTRLPLENSTSSNVVVVRP
jgi:hypothetical protein